MAKENPCLNNIEKLYKRSYFDSSLFNWVEAQRSLFKAVTVEQSILLFVRYYKLGDDNVDSLKVVYYRIQKEFYQTFKDATK
jgi:hypothetical protein